MAWVGCEPQDEQDMRGRCNKQNKYSPKLQINYRSRIYVGMEGKINVYIIVDLEIEIFHNSSSSFFFFFHTITIFHLFCGATPTECPVTCSSLQLSQAAHTKNIGGI